MGRTGTVHLGGPRSQMAAAEAAIARGRHPVKPFVLASQPTTFDPTRAPEGKHVLWAYTHVPAGSDLDPTEVVTRRIEEFAPGFRDVVLQSSARSAVELEAYNPNYVGGDIAVGDIGVRQLAARRYCDTGALEQPTISTAGQRPEEGAVENVALDDWNKVLAVNLTGAMLSARAVVPLMKKQGGGRIIVTSSRWFPVGP